MEGVRPSKLHQAVRDMTHGRSLWSMCLARCWHALARECPHWSVPSWKTCRLGRTLQRGGCAMMHDGSHGRGLLDGARAIGCVAVGHLAVGHCTQTRRQTDSGLIKEQEP